MLCQPVNLGRWAARERQEPPCAVLPKPGLSLALLPSTYQDLPHRVGGAVALGARHSHPGVKHPASTPFTPSPFSNTHSPVGPLSCPGMAHPPIISTRTCLPAYLFSPSPGPTRPFCIAPHTHFACAVRYQHGTAQAAAPLSLEMPTHPALLQPCTASPIYSRPSIHKSPPPHRPPTGMPLCCLLGRSLIPGTPFLQSPLVFRYFMGLVSSSCRPSPANQHCYGWTPARWSCVPT